MSPDQTDARNDELQFDRLSGPTSSAAAGATPAVVCAVCQAAIKTDYYQINGKSVCASCRQAVEASAATPRGARPLVQAGLFGLAGAIAGAIIYYAVIAITNFEIGIVAILIGYMVGYMVRKGAAGKGGRRFQILAVVLTYWAVGLAYAPIFFKGMNEGTGTTKASAVPDSSRVVASDTTARADSAAARAPASATVRDSTAAKPLRGATLAIGLGALLFVTFALPVMAVAGTMPSGLISALIIFIGMRQAWRMTATPTLDVSGPYRVGTRPVPAAS